MSIEKDRFLTDDKYDKGEGKVIVLLHGYLSNKESFTGIVNLLEKKFRVIAFDLPGFGKAKQIEYAYAVDDYINYVIKELDGKNIDKFILLGHSFGGRIAIKIAAKYPEKTEKLVLTGCAGLKPRRKPSYYIKVYTYKFLQLFIDKEKLDKKFGSSDYKQLSPLMRESFKKIIKENLRPYLKRIKAQTILIFGREDAETKLYMAKIFNKEIKGSSLFIMENCGHFCFVQKPAQFCLILSEFL